MAPRENQFGDPRVRGDMEVAACKFLSQESRDRMLEWLVTAVAKNDPLTNSTLLRYIPFYELYIGKNAHELMMSTGFYDRLVYPECALDGMTLENVSISKRPSEDYRGDKTGEGVVVFRRRSLLPEDDEVIRLRVTLKYDSPAYGCSRLISTHAERI